MFLGVLLDWLGISSSAGGNRRGRGTAAVARWVTPLRAYYCL